MALSAQAGPACQAPGRTATVAAGGLISRITATTKRKDWSLAGAPGVTGGFPAPERVRGWLSPRRAALSPPQRVLLRLHRSDALLLPGWPRGWRSSGPNSHVRHSWSSINHMLLRCGKRLALSRLRRCAVTAFHFLRSGTGSNSVHGPQANRTMPRRQRRPLGLHDWSHVECR